MGSPLGPIIGGIFMVKFEKNVLSTLSQYTACWKWYVDDAILYVKVNCTQHVLKVNKSVYIA